MAIQFKHGGTQILFKSSGIIAMDPDCCCVTGFSPCCFTENASPFWVSGHVNAAWPATVVVNIPGACCTALQGPFTLTAMDPAALGGGYSLWYQYLVFPKTACDGTSDANGVSIDLWCHLGVLEARIFVGGTSYFATGAAIVVLSCNPLHIQITFTITNPTGHWCAGTFVAELTE